MPAPTAHHNPPAEDLSLDDIALDGRLAVLLWALAQHESETGERPAMTITQMSDFLGIPRSSMTDQCAAALHKMQRQAADIDLTSIIPTSV